MRSYDIYVDYYTRRVYRYVGTALTELTNQSYPFIYYKEKILLNIHYLNSTTVTFDSAGNPEFDTYTGFTGLSIASSAAVDNDYNHYVEGALVGDYTGSITNVVISGLEITPASTGTIVFADEVAAVAYTDAVQDSAGNWEFTVSATLVETYLNGEIVRISEPLIIKSTTIDETAKDTGLFGITLNGNSAPFQEAVSGSSSIQNCLFEHQVKESGILIFAISFTFLCFNILDDDGIIPPPLDGNYYTKTEIDSIIAGLIERDFSALDEKTTPAATDKLVIQDSEDSAGGLKYLQITNLPGGAPPDGSITATKLATDAVETLKIKDANVTADKLATNAVTTIKITDANVTAAKLATDAVETAKIKDANVTADKLATDSVTTIKIVDANVTTAKIADLNITSAKLASNAVTTAKITDANVTAAKLASGLAMTKANVEAVLTGTISTHTHSLEDIGITNGVETPTTDLDNEDDGKIVTAQVTNTAASSEVALLLHLNNDVVDSGYNNLTVINTDVTFETSEGPSWGSHRAVLSGTADSAGTYPHLEVPDNAMFAFGTNGKFLMLVRATFGAEDSAGNITTTRTIFSKENSSDSSATAGSKGFRLDWELARGLVFRWADVDSDVWTGEMSAYWVPTEDTPYSIGVAYDGTKLHIFVTENNTTTRLLISETRAVTVYNDANDLFIGVSQHTGEENPFIGTMDEIFILKGDPATYLTIGASTVVNKSTSIAPLTGDIYVSRKYDITNSLNLGPAPELTISVGGAVTVTRPLHAIRGYLATDDDLATINGTSKGDLIAIFPGSASENITVKHGTGNIVTPDGEDLTIPDNGMLLLLNYDGTNLRIAGGSGVDGTAIHDNIAGEIHVITEKTTVVDDDEYILEDSEDSYNKKRVKALNAFPTTTYAGTFTSGDLSAGILTITHSLGEQYGLTVNIVNDSGELVIAPVTYTSTSACTVDLSTATVSGTWRYKVIKAGGAGASENNKILQKTKTGDHTLELSDVGYLIRMNTTDPTGNTVTIPLESSVAFENDVTIGIRMYGTGLTTITATSGVTLNGVDGGTCDMDAQWKTAMLVKEASDVWTVSGAISTVVSP